MSRRRRIVACAWLAWSCAACHAPPTSDARAPAAVRAADELARAVAARRVLGAVDAGPRPTAPLPPFDDHGAPPWLLPDEPSAPLAVLAGHWHVRSVLNLRRGGELVQPSFDLRSWPLLDGRLVLEHWLGGAGPHAQRGVALRGVEPAAHTWFALSAWPGADDVGWLWIGGALEHGRVTWQVQDRDAAGLPIQRRQQLSDLTPASWRLDEWHSYDGGASWRLQWWREARRRAPPATAADDAHWIDEFAGRSAAFATHEPDAAVPTVHVRRGTTRRELPDGAWASAACTWRASTSARGDVFVAEYVEEPSAAGPGLRRVSVGVRLAGHGQRADGRPWEVVRIDDRSRIPFAFSGDAPGTGTLEHAGRHGVPLARLEWVVDPTSGALTGWVESSADGPAGGWVPRVEVRFDGP